MGNKSQIRVLHYIGSLNIGGSQTMIMELYRNIDKSKFQFDFIVDKQNALFYKEEIEKLGGKVYILESFKGYNYFGYIKQLKIFFKNHAEYKIIHGHVRSIASIYLGVAKKFGLITISHSHSISNGVSLSAIVKNILQYRIRYIADYFMGCSYEANVWLFGKKVANSNKCTVLNNAIDYDKFKFNLNYRDEIRKKYNINENEFLLANVGRFHESKNHKYLIDIYEKLLEKNKETKLMLCGDGELKESIKKYAEAKGCISNIIFVDATADIYKYYSAFDLFLFPSKYEGLGMVAIEAQVSGLPVILSENIPKCVKISKNIKFLKIEDDNINEWVTQILNYSKTIKITNREKNNISSEYDIDNVVNRLEKFYIMIGSDMYEKK